MKLNSPEFKVLLALWKKSRRRPIIREYRDYVKGKKYPTAEQITKNFGSLKQAHEEFIAAYCERYGYMEIPDYYLGALFSRGKVVHEKRGSTYLRFTTKDKEQIHIFQKFLKNTSIYLAKKDKETLYLRCYNSALIATWEHLNLNEEPVTSFQPTIDFVRGYIDTHSHFRPTTPGRYRLTITGPLVPQCHDFLVSLGANDTKVFKVGESFRMNIHSKSLQKIRDSLYYPGCIHNKEVRKLIYKP